MAKLILVRHGQSSYNEKGLWTGWTDVPLTQDGIEEARKAGEAIKDIRIDHCFTSILKRAQQTLSEIKKVLNITNIPSSGSANLNERNYGVFTGKNKWEIQKEVGEENFKKIRRSWDSPIPNGETLKDVYNRVVPYYEQQILPLLIEGKNVLVCAHGNSIRALIKYLDKIADEDIASLEIGTGEVYIFDIDKKGLVISKEIRSVNPNTGKI